MNTWKNALPKALCMFVIFTLVCGVLYTGVVTGLAQLIFPHQAGGSIIEIDGVAYGSEHMGQRFTKPEYLWGRPAKYDVTTFTDSEGNALLYGAPSNLSPASDEYEALIGERVAAMRAANPDMGDAPVPVDLVTGSGSGLDPDISPAAAAYQVKRIAKARGMDEDEVSKIIDACTDGRLLGVFGEETVNVLRVNLMLDGILKE